MSLPDKPTKKIPRAQMPIGAVKDGKMKVKDGDTQKVAWRQGKGGFSRDFDGDPTSRQHNKAGLKDSPKHQAHVGRRPHKPHGM